jgi:hypothetical protein
MSEAFRLAGLDAKLIKEGGDRKALKTRSLRGRVTYDIGQLMRQHGAAVNHETMCGTLVINGVRVNSHLIRCERRARSACARWFVRALRVAKPVDLVLVMRLNNDETVKDFFLVPTIEYGGFPKWLGEDVPEGARAFQLTTGSELVSRMQSLIPEI